MQIINSKVHNDYKKDITSINLINDNNFEICFYNYGGYIHNIFIPYKKNEKIREDVILGYDDQKQLIEAPGYFNSIIGRVGNRINNSKFTLNKKVYNLNSNIYPNHLHGGNEGFNKKIWEIVDLKKNKNEMICKMRYYSKHLEEGYPGNLECYATYLFNNDNEFTIQYEAISDQDTILNLTNHNYWNFHGHGNEYQNIENHIVCVKSKSICETDENSIPTGKILDVEGTKFNLNNDFLINDAFLKNGGIDHNYVLTDFKMAEPIAIIFSKKTGLGVEYFTNQPGIQFYTGNMMLKKYYGKYKKSYGLQYGMCLEPQYYPDAINHENFPSSILRKNKKYLSKIKIKLRNDF